jgi:hypothetical protein
MPRLHAPTQIMAIDPETRECNFENPADYARAQLRETVAGMVEEQPNARLTLGDLEGFMFVQYGIDPVTFRAAAGRMQDEPDGNDLLSSVLVLHRPDPDCDPGVSLDRITLGPRVNPDSVNFSRDLSIFLLQAQVMGPYAKDVTNFYSRYPTDRLMYRGRTTVGVGSVAMLESATVVTDLITIQRGTVAEAIIRLTSMYDSQPGQRQKSRVQSLDLFG